MASRGVQQHSNKPPIPLGTSASVPAPVDIWVVFHEPTAHQLESPVQAVGLRRSRFTNGDLALAPVGPFSPKPWMPNGIKVILVGSCFCGALTISSSSISGSD
jgi:hypothetical protein